ncbi:NAD-dependent methylenetetrahydrofolate dehydrogenase isoform X2 [Rhodnius prolixus]|uniref:NAD-dependent methylenetetrahydrofolate dehydrogenase isoform X2 n=1 Tax=Rhodnius prolixus TaxID=13249 RepID=UPI003D18CA84
MAKNSSVFLSVGAMKTLMKSESFRNKSTIILQFTRPFCNQLRFQCKLIDGKHLANKVLNELKPNVTNWVEKKNLVPHLSVVMVEDNSSNESYVRMKCKAAKFVGITTEVYRVPKSTSQSEMLKLIDDLNHNLSVHGILIQLPLSAHMDLKELCKRILPNKDVDGFTPDSLGRLCLNEPSFVPCTALAVHHIVTSLGIKTIGKKAVVCGRSKHVGLPIALLLHSSTKLGGIEGLNMTTTICHRHTPPEQFSSFIRKADVLVTAVGQPNLIRGNMVKPGAVVIDVGFSEILREGQKRQLLGDVNLSEVQEVAGTLSPVPGGVGPVTVAMLMYNTFLAAKNRRKQN